MTIFGLREQIFGILNNLCKRPSDSKHQKTHLSLYKQLKSMSLLYYFLLKLGYVPKNSSHLHFRTFKDDFFSYFVAHNSKKHSIDRA